MRNLYFVLLCLASMACRDIPSNNQTVGPEEWLTFKGAKTNAKHIVLISGDEEYRSEEALPQLAKILSQRHGFHCTVLFAQNPEKPGIINANYGQNIPGLEALETADLMLIFTRFRALPDEQMQFIDEYLKKGKPVLGIRTSTHAFNFPPDSNSNYIHYSNGYSGDKTDWQDGFGRLVLGEQWISHHGHHKHQSTRGILAQKNNDDGITNGITDGDIWGATDVYGVRLPLPGDAKPIVFGQVMNRKGAYLEDDIFYGMRPIDDELATTNNEGLPVNETPMPIIWTKSYQVPGGEKGKAFTSTIGAANDLLIEGTRRILVNGVYWTLNLPVPRKADVTLVGDYKPTAFEFRTDAYWEEKQLKVSDFK